MHSSVAVSVYSNYTFAFGTLNQLDALVLGAFLAYVAGVILMMAFCSPYWVESYDESFSDFKNMGLWEYCFKDFAYPYYQYPKKFNGCHNIFSHVRNRTGQCSLYGKHFHS